MRLAILFLLASHAHALVVTILRHGETEWNVKELLQGSMDSPLTPNGVQQAILCGEKRLRNQNATLASPRRYYARAAPPSSSSSSSIIHMNSRRPTH